MCEGDFLGLRVYAKEFWWLAEKDERGWRRLCRWPEVVEMVKVGGKCSLES